MASLKQLPDEIIVKIFLYLKGDSRSTRNLIMTCTKFCSIANRILIKNQEWLHSRTLVFCCENYMLYMRGGNFIYPSKFIPYTWMWISVSGKFIRSFKRVVQQMFSSERLKLIVGLDIISVRLHYKLLTYFLERLPNLAYLNIENCHIMYIPQVRAHKSPKTLIRFALGNFNLVQAQIDGSSLDILKSLTARTIDLSGYNLREKCDLLFPRITYYLRRYKHVVREVILDRTSIGDLHLLALVNDSNLQHLSISAIGCHNLTRRSLEVINTSKKFRSRITASSFRCIPLSRWILSPMTDDELQSDFPMVAELDCNSQDDLPDDWVPIWWFVVTFVIISVVRCIWR